MNILYQGYKKKTYI